MARYVKYLNVYPTRSLRYGAVNGRSTGAGVRAGDLVPRAIAGAGSAHEVLSSAEVLAIILLAQAAVPRQRQDSRRRIATPNRQ